MGLAVIVILLAIAMFFVAKFAMPKQVTEEKQFQQRQAATGFVNTLLAANADCPGSSANFAKLIEEMTAPEYSTLSCAVDETHLKTSIKAILDETLKVWGYRYNLTIEFPDEADTSPGIISIEDGCAGALQEEAAPPFPIPTDYGNIMVVMKICY